MNSKKKFLFWFGVILCLGFVVFLTATNWDKINSTDFNLGSYTLTTFDIGNFVRLANASNEMPNNLAYNSTTQMNMSPNGTIWHLDQSWVDKSGNGFTLTAANGATFSTSSYKIGNASGSFDGINDYADTALNNFFLGSGGLTYSTWVRENSIPATYGSILSTYTGGGSPSGGLIIRIQNVSEVLYPNTYFWVCTNQTTSSVPITLNTWNHVAVSWSFSTKVFNLYLNGVLVGNNTCTSFGQGRHVIIGTDSFGTTAFNGTIDEVAYWTRPLSSAEILNIYTQQKGGYFSSGNYTSEIKDFTTTQVFKNISWTQGAHYQEELPNNQAVQTDSGGANMTGNVLNLHMNNDWLDTSGLGNNGTASGATFTTSSKLGSHAGSFDGVNDYVNITNSASINITNQITISAWIYQKGKPPVLTPYTRIIAKYGYIPWSIAIAEDSANNIYGAYFDTNTTNQRKYTPVGSYNISLNTWYHLVGVYNGTNILLYGNGVLVSSAVQNGTLQTNTQQLFIGARDDSGMAEFFNGSIDEVAVWNRSLSATEIQNLYLRGAERLNLSVRSCSTSDCSGVAWNSTSNNATLTDISFLTNNRYFQYNFEFNTNDTGYTPQLYNVSVGYEIADSQAPLVSLNLPLSGLNTTQQNITFNFTVIDNLALTLNCSIYLDNVLNQTNSSVNNGSLTNFIITNIPQGSHAWNVSCSDGTNTNTTPARIFMNDYAAPNVSLLTPTNNTISTNNTYNFTSNLTDNIGVKNATLYIYNQTSLVNETTQSFAGSVTQTVIGIPVALVDGIYNWFVKVFDWAENSQESGNYTLQIIPDYSVINLTYPLNNTDLPRGDSATAEDDLGLVGNTLTISANVYNNQTLAKLENVNCSFYLDSALIGTNLTNSSGDCIFVYDKSVIANNTYTIKANYSWTEYEKLIPESSAVINLTLNQIPNLANNARTGQQYMVGDAALVFFNITKDGRLIDPSSIAINATKSDTTVIDRYVYSGADNNIVKIGTGQYYSKTIVNSSYGGFIRWELYAYNGGNQLISTAIEADKEVISPTATINITLVNSSSIISFNYTLYDRNNYLLENRTVIDSYMRDAAAGDRYRVLSLDANNLSLNFYNLNVSTNVSIQPQLIKNYPSIPSGVDNFTDVLALNQTNFTFTTTTVKLNKKGITLSKICKCDTWNFTVFNCSGAWSCLPTSSYQFWEDSDYLWFNVTSFSAYAGGDGYSSQLTTSTTNDTQVVYQNEKNYFYANYTIFAGGQPIVATCNVSENSTGTYSTPVGMNYNATSLVYQYNKSFSQAGLFNYNVTCYGNESYDALSAIDNFTITADPVYPVFSNYWDNNASLIGSGTALFYTTVLDTNASVYLNILGGSYLATNLGNGNYTHQPFLTAGIYSYNWSSYGNGYNHNINWSENREYTVLEDLIPPYVAFISPLNNSIQGTSEILLNITNSSDAVDTWWYNTTTNLSYSQSLLYNFSDGTHIIFAYANDSYNNVNTTSVTFLIDTTGPVITILYPLNTSYNTNISNLNYSLTETNPDSCWFSNSSGVWNSTRVTPRTNFTSLTSLEGSNTWRIYCNDTANNHNYSQITFWKDTEAPYFGSLQNQTLEYNQNISYLINATDRTSSIDSFTVNDSRFIINRSTGLLRNNSQLIISEYYLNITVNDTLNNLNSTLLLVNVTQANSTIYLYLDHQRQNSSIYNGSSIYLNASLITGLSSQLIQLYSNGSLINNGTSPVSNYTLFNVSGSYNVTAFYEGNENYSRSSETWFVIVTNSTPSPSPTPTPSTSSSSGGGGGLPTVIPLTSQDVYSGKPFELIYGNVIKFNLGEESHTIKIKNINRNAVSVVFEIRSSPLLVSLKPRESAELDLNSDGKNETIFTLLDVNGFKIRATIKEILSTPETKDEPEVVDSLEDSEEEPYSEITSERPSSKSFYLYLLIFLLILLGVFFIFWLIIRIRNKH